MCYNKMADFLDISECIFLSEKLFIIFKFS